MTALADLAAWISATLDGHEWTAVVDGDHVVATHRDTRYQIRCQSAEDFALAVEAWMQAPYRN